MRRALVGLVMFVVASSGFAVAQQEKPMTLKAVLLEQLRSTHNKAEWFVPANTAVAGLTPAQASWTDKSGNHSVGQLANHLLFWDRDMLTKFKGETPAKFDGNNDETFNDFDAKSWDTTVKQLDQVMTDWENAVEAADDAKISLWASRIAHVGTHNAYHIGQMVYARREQGIWDPNKGVKKRKRPRFGPRSLFLADDSVAELEGVGGETGDEVPAGRADVE